MSAPVTNDAAGEQRNTTTAATSSASPARPSGCVVATHYGLSWQAAVLATLGVGVFIGLVNAVLVIGLEINSFIATIGVPRSCSGSCSSSRSSAGRCG